MCGIVGIVNTGGRPAEPNLLRRMVGLVRHRGPDETGIFVDKEAGLGHVRLSIIDISCGQQPMANADGSLWITFNGEIFNYIELREELIQKGHRFLTRSDTEVLLHLYQEEGGACVKKLNGQWAFGIWDTGKRSLFLSRDRFGVRPIFYYQANGSFLFASEVKALFAHPDVPRRVDLKALDEIFTFWFTLPPRTMFEGVQELPPGHSLRLENGNLTVEPHWELDYQPDPAGARTEKDYVDELFALLVDAVRLRLRADVPVGTYLSGGLDSSVITAIVKRFTDTPVSTFSVTFDDPEFDESSYQDEVIRHLGTDHQKVHCTYSEIGRVFPEVIWHAEKPILRTAPAPLFLLSKLVSDSGYKVVVTGEGSDEMLGGYDIFKEAKIRAFWGVMPDSRRRPLLLRRLYPYLTNIQNLPDEYLRAFFRVSEQDIANPFFSHLPRWELTSKIKMFLTDEVKWVTNGHGALAELQRRLPDRYTSWDRFLQAQYLESMFLLPAYILSSQGDRVAMAHSVETRLPFLDYRVVQFAANLPPKLKMKVLNEKHILKQCVGGLIPESIRRRYKQPYRSPEGKSFFQKENLEYVTELLSERRIRQDGIFRRPAVEKLVEKFRAGRAIGIKDNMALVGILSTQLIHEQFIHNFHAYAAAGHNAVDRSTATTVRC
jgi:asparagine synthase (glutamine-hydrolysing)